MADLKYTAEIDTSSADRSLAALKNSVVSFGAAIAGAFAFKELTRVSSTFEDLRTSLQILYKDAATGSKAFEEIKKFAATSVFSVEDLTNTVIKLKAAGLEPTVALLTMFGNVASVSADKVGALQAITDLYARTTAGGLGLEDLNRLADRGIPVFDILEKKIGVSRLQVSELGKTTEGARLILKTLEVGLNETFGGASAARSQNLSQAVSNLKDTFSNLFDTMGQAGMNAGLRDLTRAATALLESLKPLAYAVGLALGEAFKFIADNLKIAAAAAAAFLAVMAVSSIIRIAQAFLLLNTVLARNPIMMAIGVIAGAMAAAGVAGGDLAEKMKELDDAMKSASTGPNVIADGKLADATEVSKEKALALNEAYQKFRIEIRNIGDEFTKQNKLTLDAINLENSLIGKSKEYVDAQRAKEEIFKKAADEADKLRLAREKLTAEERKQGRGAIIDAEIARIQQLAEADAERVARATENTNRLQMLEQVRLFGLSNEFDMQKKLGDLQYEIATSTMPTLQKKYAEIDKAAQDAAKSAIRAEEQRTGRKLTTEEAKKYYEEAVKGTDALKAKQSELYEESRRFSTGWSNALNEYIDNATNAANQAQQIFGKVTSSMEDAFVNFAKTGKFEFKSMVNSIIEDLLRMQVKATLAKIMGLGGNTGGTGGLFGGKIIPGILASGGPVSGNRPYIVGERGPELFLPGVNGSMVPNKDLGGGGTVIYNIQAVDAPSFKALVARDPSFIHAVAMAGARSYPTSSR
jgi:lambda family phage tail tape measure protein